MKKTFTLGLTALNDWLSRRRAHAGFFSAPIKKPSHDYRDAPGIFSKLSTMTLDEERAAKEFIIAKEFIDGNPEFSRSTVITVEEDPPDCVIFPSNIGIEICELVDEHFADPRALQINNKQQYRYYSTEDIRESLIKIATSKDKKLIKAHQSRQNNWNYTELILLVCTDEFDISPEKAAASVQDITIPALTEISRAYLLLSYSPEHKRCPTFQFI